MQVPSPSCPLCSISFFEDYEPQPEPTDSPPSDGSVSQAHLAHNPFSTPAASSEPLKSLSQRVIKPPPSNQDSPIFEEGMEHLEPATSRIDELLRALNAPRTVETIQKRIHLAKDPSLPVDLRIKAVLSVPRTVETKALCTTFAKDTTIDINLRTSCALASFASVEKYNLLKACLNTPGLEKGLQIECLLKLTQSGPNNVSQELLQGYLKPDLLLAYIRKLPHSIFMAALRTQVLYDEAMPILLRAKCSFKALLAKDHSSVLELLANSVVLPINFRISATAALPEGPNKEELIKSFMEDPDLSTRVLWIKRLPAKQRDELLQNLLEEPNLNKDLQHVCASSLAESPLKQNYMCRYAQDASFPPELRVYTARRIADKNLKETLLSAFAQDEELSFTFRLPCLLEMPPGELRTRLLQRFAQDSSLDVNFRFPCILALPKNDFSLGLLKEVLRDTALRLSYIKDALAYLEGEQLRTSLAATLALNTLLPPKFRQVCALGLPESYALRNQILECIAPLL